MRGDGVAALLLLLLLSASSNSQAAPPRGLRAAARRVLTFARAAGWPASELVRAVAVALRESEGDPRAHNLNPPVEDSRGLWQLNVLAHPALAALNLYDPAVNAAAAFELWTREGWRPWRTPRGLPAVYVRAAEDALRGT